MVLYLSERGYISKPGESPGAPRFSFLFEIGFLRERGVKSDQPQLPCSIHQEYAPPVTRVALFSQFVHFGVDL